MIDYGALQPSPVQKPAESNKGPDTTIVQTVISPPPQEVCPKTNSSKDSTNMIKNKFLSVTLASEPMVTPPTTTQTSNGYNNNTFSWNTSNDILPLEADDTFNFEGFDLSNADIEEIMINATQDFWASFPGEVGAGYGNGYTSG